MDIIKFLYSQLFNQNDEGLFTLLKIDEKLSEKFEKFNKLYEFACELGGNKNE